MKILHIERQEKNVAFYKHPSKAIAIGELVRVKLPGTGEWETVIPTKVLSTSVYNYPCYNCAFFNSSYGCSGIWDRPGIRPEEMTSFTCVCAGKHISGKRPGIGEVLIFKRISEVLEDL